MKRFITYLSLTYVIVIFIGFGLLYLISPRLEAKSVTLFSFFLWGYIIVSLFLIFDLLWILLITIGFKGFLLRFNFPYKIMRVFWLIVISIGKLFKKGEMYLWQGFISFNNSLFLMRLPKLKRKNILLLLPHCLQLYTCGIKITGDIKRCKECGRCLIGDLKRISQRKNIRAFVATGGTLARKVVKEVRPDIIIASACEHDLGWGIFDIFPAPVFGILNERPEGPCKNTRINIVEVVDILNEIADQNRISS